MYIGNIILRNIFRLGRRLLQDFVLFLITERVLIGRIIYGDCVFSCDCTIFDQQTSRAAIDEDLQVGEMGLRKLPHVRR